MTKIGIRGSLSYKKHKNVQNTQLRSVKDGAGRKTSHPLADGCSDRRDLGGMTFVDLRDRYGITQLVFNMETNPGLCREARKLGREFVIQATGKVAERSNKNPKMPTGDIEILVKPEDTQSIQVTSIYH